jgi:hypothetical protein
MHADQSVVFEASNRIPAKAKGRGMIHGQNAAFMRKKRTQERHML